MKLTKPLSLEDLCSKNYSFIEFFLKLDAYNELRGCESIWALVFAIIITFVLFITDTILQTAYDFIGVLVPLATASIALVGFLFAGLALMSAIISIKTINVIDKDGNIKSIAGILFSFYYCGGIIISSLFFAIVLYFFFREVRVQKYVATHSPGMHTGIRPSCRKSLHPICIVSGHCREHRLQFPLYGQFLILLSFKAKVS